MASLPALSCLFRVLPSASVLLRSPEEKEKPVSREETPAHEIKVLTLRKAYQPPP